MEQNEENSSSGVQAPAQQGHEKYTAENSLAKIFQDLGIDPNSPTGRIVIEDIVHLAGYRGPIPPPDMLREYDLIRPDLVDRFLDAWEAQRMHRQNLEVQAEQRSQSRMDMAQKFGLTIALFGLSLSAAVGIWGSWIAAAVIAIVAVGGPSSASILSRHLPVSRRQDD